MYPKSNTNFRICYNCIAGLQEPRFSRKGGIAKWRLTQPIEGTPSMSQNTQNTVQYAGFVAAGLVLIVAITITSYL